MFACIAEDAHVCLVKVFGGRGVWMDVCSLCKRVCLRGCGSVDLCAQVFLVENHGPVRARASLCLVRKVLEPFECVQNYAHDRLARFASHVHHSCTGPFGANCLTCNGTTCTELLSPGTGCVLGTQGIFCYQQQKNCAKCTCTGSSFVCNGTFTARYACVVYICVPVRMCDVCTGSCYCRS